MAIVGYVCIFIVGLAILYFGAEWLLKGSVGLARRAGVSPLVIGLTLVAFGTSTPELSLDVSAAIQGSTALAFGDLVGSNIANIGLILAISAIVCPLNVRMRLLKAEVPIAISASILLWALVMDGVLSRLDGLILLAAFVLFLAYSYRAALRESQTVQKEFAHAAADHMSYPKGLLLAVLGLGGLVVGAQLMVYAAVETARLMGVSELIIGLTIVAVGTSLPELATGVVAARKKEADIVVGNVVGSNIFNLLFILAVVALICPVDKLPGTVGYLELPAMVLLTTALVPIMLRRMQITRTEGIVLVVGYAAFLLWQVWSAVQSGTAGHG